VPHPVLLHPVSIDPGAATAFKVTKLPSLTTAVQIAPQFIVEGFWLVTVPDPAPASAIVSVSLKGAGAKLAVTDMFPVNETIHGPAPKQAPLQPMNCDPLSGVAVSKTVLRAGREIEQLVPQSTPAGMLVTRPEVCPALDTDSVAFGAEKVNVAVTFALSFKVIVHGVVPVQPPPLQPAKVDPASGFAVSVTVLPSANETVSLQAVRQK
jgi:hypothetical protein